MSLPLVSICIITYNQIDFIHETITSAVEQDYENVEVIVADDGSTDGTEQVILDFARRYPQRVVPLTGGPNLGITGNSNRALQAAKGEYIAWLGGDDLFLPGKISRQMEWFLKNPDGAVCCCDVNIFDSETGQTTILYRNKEYYQGGPVTAIIRQPNAPPTSALMINMRLCGDLYFDPRTPVVSDWLYCVEACMRGKIGYVDGVYLNYRRHANNATKPDVANSHLQDRLIYTDILLAKYPRFFVSSKIQRANILYNQAQREFLAGKKSSAFKWLLKSMTDWPFLGKTYLLFVGCLLGTYGVNLSTKYRSALRKIVRNH